MKEEMEFRRHKQKKLSHEDPLSTQLAKKIKRCVTVEGEQAIVCIEHCTLT